MLAALLAAACSGGPSDSTGSSSTLPLPPPTSGRPVYVALGGSEALGFELGDPLRDAWPQQVYREAFDTTTTFVNLASPDATVAAVRDVQVPAALALGPTTVTVWAGEADVRAGTDPAEVADATAAAVRALRDGGVDEVIVVTTTAGAGAALAEVIHDAAAAAGATGVALSIEPITDVAEVHDRIAASIVDAIDP